MFIMDMLRDAEGQRIRHCCSVHGGGEDEGGRRDEARVAVSLSLISNLAEKAHSPQYFSWMRMGGSYNGMKMSMVFVFWGTDLAQITGPPSRRRDT